MKQFLTLPLLLLLGLAACQKPKENIESSYNYNSFEPLVLYTSLHDTLSEKAMKGMKLEKVDGLKIKYPTGNYSSYFEYMADPHDVLREIGHASFPVYASIADTLCRKVDYKTLALMRQNISATEQETCSFFWNVNEHEFEVYECFKGSLKHTLLINHHSNQILHRIEFVV